GAERLAGLLKLEDTLLVLVGLNVACGVLTLLIGPPRTRERETKGTATNTPYLRQVAALVALIALSGAFLDYALKAEASVHFESDAALLRFFGLFYTATGVCTFIAQLVLTPRMLTRFGLGGALSVLPLFTLAFGALGAAIARLWTVALLRGAESVAANSVFRSAYELLYTPLPAEQKRAAKTIVDVAFERLGSAAGAGLVLAALALFPDTSSRGFTVVAMGVALVALALTQRVHAGYVRALAASLKSGALRLTDSDIFDATTRQTLTETTMALDREQLLSEIEALRKQREQDAKRDSMPAAPVFEQVTDAEELLERRPLPSALVGFVIPLLDHPEHYRAAIESLASTGDRSLGHLSDALLDDANSMQLRRRLPRVLARSGSPRAARALIDGLEAPLEIRVACAKALRRRRADGAKIPAEPIHRAVLQTLKEKRDETRRLECVFILLGTVHEADAVDVAQAALSHRDESLRGTALEYLEVVLPKAVRDALWPHIAAPGTKRAPKRSREQVVEALLTSAEAIPRPAKLKGG
ncbi:MAG: Npt1/Npt2 family nucleotide transporter, partial [Myxococcota bacterium]